ncbi:DUF1360 domain-containing protein [Actinophytocola sp.]|uniref:DUF1360 domain-containing protein n=1 Tax=Actinophytocola sp. TaxID=1872138 RepID=UPI00389ABE0D
MVDTAEQPGSVVRRLARRAQRGYAHGADRPLGGYVAVIGTYSALLGLVSGVARARGVRLPERVGVGDTVLLCLGTHKASRLLTKDAVTSPLRAPFTRYQEPAGAGEVNEEVREDGAVRHAVGELFTCPFCLSVWLATGFTAGLVFAPRLTRLALTVLTAVAGSDTIQFVYDSAKQRA